jgi:hypothetical protein
MSPGGDCPLNYDTKLMRSGSRENNAPHPSFGPSNSPLATAGGLLIHGANFASTYRSAGVFAGMS